MIENLSTDTTVADFKAILASLANIPPTRLKVLSGFPPKQLDLSKEEETLGVLGLRPRDTIIVEESATSFDNNNPIFGDPSCAREKKNSTMSLGSRSQQRPEGGILLRHEVPSNNSCLFTSVYFCMSGGKVDHSIAPTLRKIISDTVSSDPVTYNEGFLGKSNREYCTWIMNDDHWGGAIELSILSKYYGVEIVAVDTQNVRLNRFGEDMNYDSRIFLIYDGIHYDPLKLEVTEDNVITMFSTSDETILAQALSVAEEAKKSRQFTDVQNFTLVCNKCKSRLTGQREATEHAMKTGHTDFGEV